MTNDKLKERSSTIGEKLEEFSRNSLTTQIYKIPNPKPTSLR